MNVCLRMLYCAGNGQESLSALGVSLVCHASNVFRVLKVPLFKIYSNFLIAFLSFISRRFATRVRRFVALSQLRLKR